MTRGRGWRIIWPPRISRKRRGCHPCCCCCRCLIHRFSSRIVCIFNAYTVLSTHTQWQSNPEASHITCGLNRVAPTRLQPPLHLRVVPRAATNATCRTSPAAASQMHNTGPRRTATQWCVSELRKALCYDYELYCDVDVLNWALLYCTVLCSWVGYRMNQMQC